MQRRRSAAILGSLLMLMTVAVQPAAAYKEIHRSGDVYEDGPQVTDELASPGAVCVYTDNAGSTNDKLRIIRVKQFHTHARYEQKTWVGFQLQITRNLPPYSDNQYRAYQATPIVKKRANQEEVAFFSAAWQVPAGAPKALYRAVIKLYYYEPGSKTAKEGEIRGRLEAYRQKLGSTSAWTLGDIDSPGHCKPKFAPPTIL